MSGLLLVKTAFMSNVPILSLLCTLIDFNFSLQNSKTENDDNNWTGQNQGNLQHCG